MKAEAEANDKDILASVFNVVNYNSHANTTINSALNATGNIDIQSLNNFENNQIKSNSKIGVGFVDKLLKPLAPIFAKINQVKEIVEKVGEVKDAIVKQDPKEIFGAIKDIVDEQQEEAGGEGNSGKNTNDNSVTGQVKKVINEAIKSMGNKLSGSISFQYVDENNTAEVNINKNVTSTGGNVNILAKTDMKDVFMPVHSTTNNDPEIAKTTAGTTGSTSTTGTTGTATTGTTTGTTGTPGSTKGGSQQEYGASLAVLAATIKNDSKVTIGNGTKIEGQSVAIKGETLNPYDRINRTVEIIDKLKNTIVNILKDKPINDASDAFSIALNKLKTAIDGLKEPDINNFDQFIDDIAGNLKDLGIGLKETGSSLADNFSNIKEEYSKPFLIAFDELVKLNYERFANFIVRAEQSDGKGAKNQETGESAKKLGVSGSFSYTDITNDSNVIIGKNANIVSNGNNGSLDINAITKSELVTFSGNAGINPIPGSQGTAIGANIIYAGQHNNGLALVSEGAKLTGAVVNVNSDNKFMQNNIAFASGKSEGKAFGGLIVIGKGDSNAVAVVDDEAEIKAKDSDTKNEVGIKASNNTIVNNIAAGYRGGEGAAVGIGVGIGLYTNNSIAAIMDIDKDASSSYVVNNSLSEEEKQAVEREASALALVLSRLNNNEQDLLGTSSIINENRGITANKVNIGSTATGLINTIGFTATAASEPKKDDGDRRTTAQKIKDSFTGNLSIAKEKQESAASFIAEFDDLFSLSPSTSTSNSNSSTNSGNSSTSTGNTDPNKTSSATSKIDKVDKTMSGEGNKGSKPNDIVTGKGGSAVNNNNDDLAHNKGNAKPGEAAKSQDGKSNSMNSGSVADSNAQSSQEQAKSQIAGAGSVAVNIIAGQTIALANKALINVVRDTTNTDNKNTVTVNATDNVFIGAWSGGGAYSKSKESNSYGLAGSAAVNSLKRDVGSFIHTSTINNAEKIIAEAVKDGIVASGGLAAAISMAKNTSVAASAAISINLQNSQTSALLINNTINNSGNVPSGNETDITTNAVNKDINVTGGMNISFAKSKYSSATAAGGSIIVSDLQNHIDSGIYGGTYRKIKDINVEGVLATTQVSVGIGVAVSSGTGGGAFQGTVVYNGLSNVVNSVIKGQADISASGTVVVNAHDDKAVLSSDEKDKKKSDYIQFMKDRGIDPTGEDYRSEYSSNESTVDPEEQKNAANQNKDDKQKADKEKYEADGKQKAAEQEYQAELKNAPIGNTIVVGGLTIAGSKGGDAVGASVVVNDIENKMYANIIDANITSKHIGAASSAKSLLVGVAGGIAGGNGKFAAAGSVSWSNVADQAITKVENSTLTANSMDFNAVSNARSISVAGQIGVSKGSAGLGLALAYHALDNQTKVLISDSTLTSQSESGFDLLANALSQSKVIAVGAGVTANLGGAALNGTFAVNEGTNNTEVILDSNNLTNVQSVSATATDESTATVVAGGVTLGAGTAASGAVAINSIGGFSTNSQDENAQRVTAAIRNTTITTVKNPTTITNKETNISRTEILNSKISLNAVDHSKLWTISAGAAGSTGSVALQGVASSSIVNKNVWAGLENSNISAANTEKLAQANVNANAVNESAINGFAIGVAGSAGVAGGIAINVNRIIQHTNAQIIGGDYHINNVELRANGKPEILSATVGAAGSSNAAVAGSFGTNLITNTVNSNIKNAKINALSNVGVLTQSDELIANYAGAVAGSGGAAIGLTVTVNKIDGNTSANVENSDIKAKQNADDIDVITANDGMDGTKFIHAAIEKATFDSSVLNGGRQSSTYNGLVVNSSATHSIASSLVSGGGAGIAAVMGTINVNLIGGSTQAKVINTNVNTGDGTLASDISVKARDYTNAAGFTGTVAGAGIASVGAGSDTNKVERTTEAYFSSKGKTATANKAKNVYVDAFSRQALSTFDLGASGAAGVGATGIVVVNKLNSTTSAKLENVHINYDNLYVKAIHQDGIYVTNAALAGGGSAGFGLNVSVVKQESNVNAEVKNSDLTAETDENQTEVIASHTGELDTVVTAAGVGGAGIAGAVAVNNMKQQVSSTIDNSNINRGTTNVHALNSTTLSTNGGALGAGGFGFGSSISVNTFNDRVSTSIINHSKLNVKDIDIKSENKRNIDQVVINAAAGGIAVGANIMVTNIDADLTDAELKGKLNEVNGRLDGDAKFDVNRSNNESGIYSDISNSTLTASNQIKINAIENSATSMHGGSVAGGGAAFNGAVGILNRHHSTKVNFTDSTLSSGTVVVKAEQANLNGKGTELNLYQGTGGVIAIGAAFGRVTNTGTTQVNVTNTSITSTGDTNIDAKDTSSTAISAYGLTGGAIAAGIIYAAAENSSNVGVNFDTRNSTVAETISTKNLVVNASKENKVTTKVVGGAVGFAGGVGLNAEAKDSGETSIKIQGSKYKFIGESVTFAARSNPIVNLNAGSAAAGMYAGQVTRGFASATGTTEVVVNDDNTFDANNLSFTAETGKQGGTTPNVTAKVVGVSLSGAVGIGVNIAQVETATNTNVTVGRAIYKSISRNAAGQLVGTALNIAAQNYLSRSVDISSLTVGGLFATGNGSALSYGTDNINIAARGGIINGDNINSSVVKSFTLSGYGINKVNALANGDGGGLVDISPLSALSQNRQTTNVTATLGGKWDVKENLTVATTQTDEADLHAESTKAGAAVGGGTKADNRIDGSNTVNIENGSEITAHNFGVNALNNIVTGKNYAYEVEGQVFAIAGVSVPISNSEIGKSSNINIGSGTKIFTTGYQSYNALTNGDLKNKIKGMAVGVIGVQVVKSTNALNIANNINVAENTTLHSKGDFENNATDISFNSSDNIKSDFSSYAETPAGLAAVLYSETQNKLTRSNSVNLLGKVRSSGDLNLLAGKKGNNVSNIAMNLTAEVVNNAVIPLSSKPVVSNQINSSNQVIVGNNVEGVATKDINIYADDGKVTVSKISKAKTWLYTTTDKGEETTPADVSGDAKETKSVNNFAKINGKLISGANNTIDISISGYRVPDMLLLADGEGKDTRGSYTITIKENGVENKNSEWKSSIREYDYNYSTDLINQYNEATKLMNQHSNDVNKTAYLGYLSTRQRLLSTMKKYGLVDEDVSAESTITINPNNVRKYSAVGIDNIFVSGGSINITSNNLIGENKDSSLQANGSPTINVTNNSNAVLTVSNLKVGNAGGAIRFNGEVLDNNALNTIQNKNQDKAQNTTFGKITSIAEGGGIVSIINNSAGNRVVKSAYNSARTDNYKPLGMVIVSGTLTSGEGRNNVNGRITINNNAGDLELAQNSQVLANTVELKATGSIVQNHVKGLLSLGGGTPERAYADYAQQQKEKTEVYKETAEKTSSFTETPILTDGVETGYGPRIAGNNVYLFADVVNLNGIVQSGYDTYTVTLNSLSGSKRQDGKVVISEGGERLRGDGIYNYNIGAVYDPAMDKIKLDDVDAVGGYIEITGSIIATENATLVVSDGGANINIVNNTGKTLELGNIYNNYRQGKIVLNNGWTNTRTEIVKENNTIKQKSININDYVKCLDKCSNWSTKNGNIYDLGSITYNWTEGTENTAKTKYTLQKEGYLFGAFKTDPESIDIRTMEGVSAPIALGVSESGLAPGAYLSNDDTLNTRYRLQSMYTYLNSKLSKAEFEMIKDYWFYRVYEATQYLETGSKRTYIHSVKANYPVTAEFIGQSNGGKIEINSNSTITIKGDIENEKSGALLSINSSKDIIQEVGQLKTNNLSLIAGNNIKNIEVKPSETNVVNLTAESKGSNGNININVIKGFKNNNSLDTKVNIIKLEGKGSTQLTAYSDIYSSDNKTTVTGRKITLESENGSIYGANASSLLKVNAGQYALGGDPLSASINAKAKNDIRLEQTTGNMRVGNITAGNSVYLTAMNGRIVDALPRGKQVESDVTDRLIKGWIDAGLIAGTSEYKGAYKQGLEDAVTDYEDSMRKAFADYAASVQEENEQKEAIQKRQAYKVTQLYDRRIKEIESLSANDDEKRASIEKLDSIFGAIKNDNVSVEAKAALYNDLVEIAKSEQDDQTGLGKLFKEDLRQVKAANESVALSDVSISNEDINRYSIFLETGLMTAEAKANWESKVKDTQAALDSAYISQVSAEVEDLYNRRKAQINEMAAGKDQDEALANLQVFYNNRVKEVNGNRTVQYDLLYQDITSLALSENGSDSSGLGVLLKADILDKKGSSASSISLADIRTYGVTKKDAATVLTTIGGNITKEEALNNQQTLRQYRFTQSHENLASLKGTLLKVVSESDLSNLVSQANQSASDVTAGGSSLQTATNSFINSVKTKDTNYQALVSARDNPQYKWTQDQLLYAISDAMYNKETLSTDSELKRANISAKQVTLTGLGVGIDEAPSDPIAIKGLGNRIDDLKKLANAEVSDVELTKDKSAFIIKGKVPLGIFTDQLNINTTGSNVYVAGRSNENDALAAINIGTIDAGQGDIRILGKAGVYNGLSDAETTNFIGKDLLLEGGEQGNVGAADKPMSLNLKGNLDVRAINAYLINHSSTNPLSFNGAYVVNDLIVDSKTGLGSVAGGLGYINVGKNLTIKTEGDIGEVDNSLRVLANNALITIEGKDGNATPRDVYLLGKSQDHNGILHLGNITANTLIVDSEGNLVLGSSEDETSARKQLNIKDKTALSAEKMVTVSGIVNSEKDLTITSRTGSVQGSANSNINVGNVIVNTAKGIALNQGNHQINIINIHNVPTHDSIDGNVLVKTTADVFTANIDAPVIGNINLENTTGGINVASELVAKIAKNSDGSIIGDRIGNILVTAGKGITSNSSIAADGLVRLESKKGSIDLIGNVESKQADVKLHAQSGDNIEGNINVNGQIKAELGGITAETDHGNIIFGGNILAKNDIIAKVTNIGAITITGNAQSDQDVKAETKAGDIALNGTVTAARDVFTKVETTGAISVTGNTQAGHDVQAQTKDGDIRFAGAITANNDVIATAQEQGAISLEKDVTATNHNIALTTKVGAIDVKGNATAGNDLIANTETGAITITGNAQSGQDVKVETKAGDIVLNGAVTAARDVFTKAETTGAISVTGNTQAGHDVQAQTKGGDIRFAGAITANNDVIATAQEQGAISLEKDVTATNHNIALTTKVGAIDVKGNATAGNDLAANTETGAITITGNAQSGNDIAANTIDGDIAIKGNVRAKRSVVAESTGVGAISVEKDVTAELQDVHLTTNSGNIGVGGNVKAKQDVSTLSQTGDIVILGDVTANNDVTARTVKDGDIVFTGNVSADQDILAHTIEKGDIIFNGNVRTQRSIVANAENTGSVIIRQDIDANKDIVINAHNGNIFFDGNNPNKTEDISAIARTGDIIMTLTGVGDIKDTHRIANGDRAFLKAEQNNISIHHSGVGVVDLYKTEANGVNKTVLADGSAYIEYANGNIVEWILANPKEELVLTNTQVGKLLRLHAQNVNIGEVTQRPGVVGDLTIAPDGYLDDMAITKLNINNIQPNDGNGVSVSRLWAYNAYIHANAAPFTFDQLYILDKATFSNNQTVTRVYGRDPRIEAMPNNFYWIDTHINSPKDSLSAWLAGVNDGRWMNLKFVRGNIQDSTGHLLDLDDNYFVYSQRIPLTDEMTHKTLFDDFGRSFGKNIVGNYYQDFYRYPWTHFIDNKTVTLKSAQEDEIIVAE
ncbi:hypothetical protein [Gallibacterium salpingitidis]|uniref:hypothetical protein n=1 Tax=Gallibacterium salpingitidis TaxID=505341 RepID=UPI001E64C6DF|nr:hypothetical protein [Gallibacterium salpingitidis]